MPFRNSSWSGLALVFLVSALVISLSSLAPPNAARGLAEGFSLERAVADVDVLATAPHPSGTPAHRQVRNYIVEQLEAAGLRPRIKRSVAIGSTFGDVLVAGTVENIMARLPGTRGGPPVVLSAHYDTARSSPGAGDNSAGVAALLESARVLSEGPPLDRDLLLLFTDGEEVSLLGARAFVAEHQDESVAAVLNFDARGARGPSLMFEDFAASSDLLDALAATPRPTAYSFTADLSRLLGRQTDFLIYRQAGWPGLSFAFIGEVMAYHTALDSADRLDTGSLMHHGTYALALAKTLATAPRAESSGTVWTYFSVGPWHLLRYPAGWNLPLAVVGFVVLLILVIGRMRQQKLGAKQLLRGFLLAVTGLLLTLFATVAMLFALPTAYTASGTTPWSALPGDATFTIGVLLVVLLVFSLLYRRWGQQSPGLLPAGLLLWAVIALMAAVTAPAASYLFLWPSLIGIAAWWHAGKKDPEEPNGWLAFLAAALMAILWLPALILMATAFGIAGPAPALAGALLLLLLMPMLKATDWLRGRRLPGLIAAALLCFSWPAMSRLWGAEATSTNTLFYVADLDQGTAAWLSADPAPDAWTTPVLGDAELQPINDLFDTVEDHLLRAPATLSRVPEGPRVELLEERTEGAWRRLQLAVRPTPGAFVSRLYLRSNGGLDNLIIGGHEAEVPKSGENTKSEQMGLDFHAPSADGYILSIDIRSGSTLTVSALDQHDGLPSAAEGGPGPRPPGTVAAPQIWHTDSTFVRRSFEF